MKILSIPFNYNELISDLKELSKHYDVSIGVKSVLNEEKLPEWDENYNKKYIIVLFDEGYIGYYLYENYCKNYLERRLNNEKG